MKLQSRISHVGSQVLDEVARRIDAVQRLVGVFVQKRAQQRLRAQRQEIPARRCCPRAVSSEPGSDIVTAEHPPQFVEQSNTSHYQSHCEICAIEPGGMWSWLLEKGSDAAEFIHLHNAALARPVIIRRIRQNHRRVGT